MLMRAMLLTQPRPAEESPLRAVEIETPVPGAGEVRVRVHCCALCHTDLHTVEGDLALPKLPVVPGHQIVGVVDAVGAGVRQLREGDRVGIPWLHSTCGVCRYCRSGQENLCDARSLPACTWMGATAKHARQRGFLLSLPAVFR